MVKRGLIIGGCLLASALLLGIGYTLGVYKALYRGSTIAETSPDADKLRWLDKADVIADFKEHVEQQRDTRFVSMFAFSTADAIGLDDTPEVQRLVQRHGERHLEGTGDVISSAEQQRLQAKAGIYVHQYNILLLRYLREHPDI
jgi:hypothetical protein